MIKIYGKIESLKKIRTALIDHGLTEFNSIGEINTFQQNYDAEVRRIREEAELEVARDEELLDIENIKLEKELDQLREQVIAGIDKEIEELQQRIIAREHKESKNIFQRIVNKSILTVLRFRKQRIEKSSQNRVKKATADLVHKIEQIEILLKPYASNKAAIIERRIAPKLSIIEYTKGVLEEINPLIAGAIGEHKVEKELEGLSINGVLINDFSVNFDPPIYNRKEKDRIYSVQIDHLLITGAGIFVLETKNWSKKSIERLDLRSPVAQVKRSSYALFVLVNSTNDRLLGLMDHHWGKKQIPIRSLIVMIGQKPKENFKYVKIKTLSELNGYIEHFEPIFKDEEIYNIAHYLRSQQRDDTNVSKKKGTRISNSSSFFVKDRKKSINDHYKDRWS
ncbi:MAG: nuclease-related domain-containing protein [Saprospiraceae bacterium]|nr:nuclease-related domain-containing protein [Saprospiraceae bacterium]